MFLFRIGQKSAQYAAIHASDEETGASDLLKPQSSQDHEDRCFVRWIFCVSTALVSTKYLLVERGYHYPFHLLVVQLSIAQLISIFVDFRRSKHEFYHYIHDSERRNDIPWLRLLAPAIPAAIAIPLFVQAILHFPNLPTLAMLMVLASFVENLIVRAYRRTLFEKRSLVELVLLAFCCFVLLFDEYRLTVNGLVFALTSITLFGISRAASQINYDCAPEVYVEGSFVRFIRAMTAFIALLLTCGALSLNEPLNGLRAPGLQDYIVMVFNFGSIAAAAHSGTSVLFPRMAKTDLRQESHQRKIFKSIYSNLYFVGTVLAASSIWATRAFTTKLQLVAYLSAILCVAIMGEAKPTEDDTDSATARTQPSKSWKNPLSKIFGALYTPILLIPLILYNFSDCYTFPQHDIQRTTMDRAYNPNRDLDIVISMYHENPSHVRQVVDTLRQVPAIAERNATVIIYNKGGNYSHSLEATGANTIINLPNRGREAAAYLHHITHNWDNLANHTFFIQADVHNPREFYSRIEDYYIASTGFLSLGFAGNACSDCSRCTDRFGWTDESGTLQSIYRRTHDGVKCDRNPVLLSYKGQFVVSAARIRATDKELFDELLRDLTNPGSWTHSDNYLKGRPDDITAPWFGYTVERMWNLLFKCNDMSIAWKCPTLLSGKRSGGDLTDCQCLDTV